MYCENIPTNILNLYEKTLNKLEEFGFIFDHDNRFSFDKEDTIYIVLKKEIFIKNNPEVPDGKYNCMAWISCESVKKNLPLILTIKILILNINHSLKLKVELTESHNFDDIYKFFFDYYLLNTHLRLISGAELNQELLLSRNNISITNSSHNLDNYFTIVNREMDDIVFICDNRMYSFNQWIYENESIMLNIRELAKKALESKKNVLKTNKELYIELYNKSRREKELK